MKNVAVEYMVRAQFNIPSDFNVNVKCLGHFNGMYEFEVEWWDMNFRRFQSNFKLPHIEYMVDERFMECDGAIPDVTPNTPDFRSQPISYIKNMIVSNSGGSPQKSKRYHENRSIIQKMEQAVEVLRNDNSITTQQYEALKVWVFEAKDNTLY
jgi:hypothetical protein